MEQTLATERRAAIIFQKKKTKKKVFFLITLITLFSVSNTNKNSFHNLGFFITLDLHIAQLKNPPGFFTYTSQNDKHDVQSRWFSQSFPFFSHTMHTSAPYFAASTQLRDPSLNSSDEIWSLGFGLFPRCGHR